MRTLFCALDSCLFMIHNEVQFNMNDIELSGTFYEQLSKEDRDEFVQRLDLRRRRFCEITEGIRGGGFSTSVKNRILLVGDKPGPSRPDGEFHHTPFYSAKHCSGWLNAQLVIEDIEEEDLVWINAIDHLDNPLPTNTLTLLQPSAIILLGLPATKWFTSTENPKQWKLLRHEHHPQYWKRFRASERYPLLNTITELKNIVELGKREESLEDSTMVIDGPMTKEQVLARLKEIQAHIRGPQR